MGEAVVVLLPDMRREQVVQRRDLPPPGQFGRDLQPFRMLAEHRVDNADERLVAVEQAVPPGQEIAFQPSLALVLAQHGVQHATIGAEELVVRHLARIPLPLGDLENGAEHIRECLVRAENAEIARLLIAGGDVAQELPQHHGVLRGDGTGRRHVDGVSVKVGHPEVEQQRTTVGVRIGPHAPIACWRQLCEFGDQPSVLVKQLLGLVAPHPAFEVGHVLGVCCIHQDRDLMGAERPLDLQPIEHLGSGPALR